MPHVIPQTGFSHLVLDTNIFLGTGDDALQVSYDAKAFTRIPEEVVQEELLAVRQGMSLLQNSKAYTTPLVLEELRIGHDFWRRKLRYINNHLQTERRGPNRDRDYHAEQRARSAVEELAWEQQLLLKRARRSLVSGTVDDDLHGIIDTVAHAKKRNFDQRYGSIHASHFEPLEADEQIVAAAYQLAQENPTARTAILTADHDIGRIIGELRRSKLPGEWGTVRDRVYCLTLRIPGNEDHEKLPMPAA